MLFRSIFEWNLGYSLLWMKTPIFQLADVVGFWGLSTWILVAQAFVAYGFIIRKTRTQKAISIFSFVLIAIVALTAIGLKKEEFWSRTDSEVQFGVVQGNIGNAEKILSEQKDQFQSFILKTFTDLTDAHLKENPQTEILLWPETAMPFALDLDFQQRFLQKSLMQKVQDWQITLLTGGYSQSTTKKDHLGYPLTRNSVFFIGPHLQLQGNPYHKTALLVFGEYMPFGEELPILYKLLPFVGVYERGPGPSPTKVILKNQNEIILGPQVCYESLDPAFSRGLSDKGAEILFNVTNDSWFGWWAEPYQHNTMTLARAIEVRRPLIRSTNTGITSAILANGLVLQESSVDQSWAYTYKIPYLKNPPSTFYTRVGHWDWIFWGLIFLLLIAKGNYVRN